MNADPTSFPRAYWCFISYRHADNKEPGRQWATWLHQAIETYEIPEDLVGSVNDRGDTIPKCIFPVFRDEEELPVDADLATPIYRALDASKFLVVICSPRAVASKYVGSEIKYFKQLGRSDRVLAVMIEGEPNASWDAGKQAAGFKVEDECFPDAMRHKVASDGSLLDEQTEPIAADFRLGTEQGWTSPEAYRLALHREGPSPKGIEPQVDDYRKKSELMKLKIIAGILGVSLGTLTKRDKAYQLALAQTRAKTLRRWLAAVGLLAAIAIGAGLAFFAQKIEAEAQKRQAIAEKQQTQLTLAQSYFVQGGMFISDGWIYDGLPYLAKSLRIKPGGTRAAMLAYGYLSGLAIPRTILQHPTAVLMTKLSPDEKRIFTTANDGVYRTWDALTGKIISEMKPKESIGTLAFSDDGATVLTFASNNEVVLWNGTTGNAIGSPLKFDSPVAATLFAPDSRHILVSTWTKAQLFDVATGQPTLEFAIVPGKLVEGLFFSPDCLRLAVVDNDGAVQILDGATGQLITRVVVPNVRVSLVRFSPDGTKLVLICQDNAVRVCDAATGNIPFGPMQHAAPVFSAEFSPDGARIVTASGITARVWDANSGLPLTLPLQHQGLVLNACFSPTADSILTISDRVARIWDIKESRWIALWAQHLGDVRHAFFNHDGTRVFTEGDDTVRIWDTRKSEVPSLCVSQPGTANIEHAEFSSDSSRVLSYQEKTVYLTNVKTGLPAVPPIVLNDNINCAVFSPDRRHVLLTAGQQGLLYDVATGHLDSVAFTLSPMAALADFSPDGSRIAVAGLREVRVWDLASGKWVGQPMPQTGLNRQVIFSPNGKIVGTVDTNVELWDSATGAPLTPVLKHRAQAIGLAFSPDSSRVVTTSYDFSARIWDTRTGRPIGLPLLHQGPVASACFSPDGKRVATASMDKTAQVWDASTGQPVSPPMHHIGAVNSVRFNVDGTLLISASFGGAHVWDSFTGKEVMAPMVNSNVTAFAEISPDQRYVVSESWDHTVRIWEMPPDGPAPAWLADALEAAAFQRIDATGASTLYSEADLEQLRQERLASVSNDPWDVFGRWLFSDPQTRTLMPGSSVMMPEYVQRLIAEGTAESLDEAEKLSYGEPDVQKQIDAKRMTLPVIRSSGG